MLSNQLESMFKNAISEGNLDLVKQLVEKEVNSKWPSCIVSYCIQFESFEILKYALNNGCEWDLTASKTAMEEGRLDSLKFIFENGYPWHPETLNYLINVPLECVQYAVEKGCPFGSATSGASCGGELETLKYLHECGCPWDKETISLAIQENEYCYFDCVLYAIKNGCPYDKDELNDVIIEAIDDLNVNDKITINHCILISEIINKNDTETKNYINKLMKNKLEKDKKKIINVKTRN